MSKGFKELAAAIPKPERPVVNVQAPPQPAPAAPSNPLDEAIASVLDRRLQPMLSQLTSQTQATADKADFYSDPKFGWAHEYRDDIEQRFNTLAANGRALSRQDIALHLRGEKFYEFAEKHANGHEAKVRAAAAAGATVGAGSAPHVAGGEPDFANMSEKELESYLADKVF